MSDDIYKRQILTFKDGSRAERVMRQGRLVAAINLTGLHLNVKYAVLTYFIAYCITLNYTCISFRTAHVEYYYLEVMV